MGERKKSVSIKSPLGINRKYQTFFQTLFDIVSCFFTMYIFLFLLSLPLSLLICYRFFLKLVLKVLYRGQVILINCSSACFGAEWFGNMMTIYYFLYVEGGNCDIKVLRNRLNLILTTFKDKEGHRPYEVMLSRIVTKFGFFCWENTRETGFDIKNHVKHLPGCDDPSRIYSEAEVFEASGKIADDIWDESKPRWEILVVPKMRKDADDKLVSVIHLRINHTYVDGISALQFARLCLVDQPAPKMLIDPVNPPLPAYPFWFRLVTYLQVFFLGPWASLKFMDKEKATSHVFYEGPLKGTKFFGRSQVDIPLKSFRILRHKYKCTTGAILHCGFTSALRKIGERKGYPIPDEVITNLVFAKLPYPHEYPQNRATFGSAKIPMGTVQDLSVLNRLEIFNEIYKKATSKWNNYTLITSRLFLSMIGLFPAKLVPYFMGTIKISYALSNVPGLKEKVRFDGKEVCNAFGVGPTINGIRYFLGVGCYDDKLTFGFQVEKSSLVKDRAGLLELIEEFDNEMKTLLDSARGYA